MRFYMNHPSDDSGLNKEQDMINFLDRPEIFGLEPGIYKFFFSSSY